MQVIMFKLVLVIFVFTGALAAPKAFYNNNNNKVAEDCNPDLCKLPDCRCSSTDVPGGLNPTEIPQLVMITFDDAVNIQNMDFYKQAFYDRFNPDGCPISTTYFVSHEYTDYSMVHELHAKGHEIALHSITHTPNTQTWNEMDVSDILAEFGDEKILISHFANISIDDLTGMRLPFLQMSGDTSFTGMEQMGLKYDSSWPTVRFLEPPMWPYTLDYMTTQDCPIGPCPEESHPGIWESPMISWKDNSDRTCSMVDACIDITDNVDGQRDFMINNFNRHYNTNRAPFGVFLHASWFMDANHFNAFLAFVDYLQSLSDVYIVSMSRMLEWVQNPQKLGDLQNVWPECQPTKDITCRATSCNLQNGDRYYYFTQCLSQCPNNYPWLGNPLGN